MQNEYLSVNDQDGKIILSSGISHSFEISHAIKYGLDEAIMIKFFLQFITASIDLGINRFDGRNWICERLEDLSDILPFWTVKQLRRIIKSLIKQDVIVTGTFNKNWSDRTTWYEFSNQNDFVKAK